MKNGDEVIYTRPRGRQSAATFRAVVIGHTLTRVRVRFGDGKISTVSYRHVRDVPATLVATISEEFEQYASPAAIQLVNESFEIEIGRVRFVDPEVIQ